MPKKFFKKAHYVNLTPFSMLMLALIIQIWGREWFLESWLQKPQHLAGRESPLCHLVDAYWPCKTQSVLSLCASFINFSCSRTFAAFCTPSPLIHSLHKHLSKVYTPSTVLLTAVQRGVTQVSRPEGTSSQNWQTWKRGGYHTLGLVLVQVCCVEKYTQASLPLSVPGTSPSPPTGYWPRNTGTVLCSPLPGQSPSWKLNQGLLMQ